MADNTQTFANHAQRARGWLFTALLALIGFLVAAWLAYRNPTAPIALGFLSISAALIGVALLVRGYATRLQDRIIRLEMQVRAARLGIEPQLARASMRQVVALRFASDVELPDLLSRALAENLDPIQIKRQIKDWQGDYARV
jgi:uncharacterized membrane protein YeaQ/YmgE (transglycosylase-associated protein family)